MWNNILGYCVLDTRAPLHIVFIGIKTSVFLFYCVLLQQSELLQETEYFYYRLPSVCLFIAC